MVYCTTTKLLETTVWDITFAPLIYGTKNAFGT